MTNQNYEINKYTNSMGMNDYKPCTPDEAESTIQLAAALNQTTPESVRERLDKGAEIAFAQQSNYYYTHAYKTIRIRPAPRPAPKLVKCSCGHSIPANQVMNASMGSSCPDCYDRLSY